jgi:hypothetical protein
MPVDLEAFFEALQNSEIASPGETPTANQPCRRADLTPEVIECEESFFVREESTVRMGNFLSQPAGWNCEVLESGPAASPGEPRPQRTTRHCPEDEAMVLTPVNGDPSVTYAYLQGGLTDDEVHIECGQGSGIACGDDHRLDHMRNDPDRVRLSRELVNLEVSPDPRFPYAFGTHRTQGAASLFKLDGLRGPYDPGDWQDPLAVPSDEVMMVNDPEKPALIDLTTIFTSVGGGAYGLAQRPCDREDAPTITKACSEPLVYAGYRAAAAILEFSTTAVSPSDLGPAQACDGPDEVEEEGISLVECEAQIASNRQFSTGGLNTFGIAPTLTGDMAFSSDGEALFVVASNPGALIRINTGVDANGDTINEPNAYIELCDRPASMVLYEDGLARYAVASCYRSSEIFIIDADAMEVVTFVRAGTGPHRLTVDYAREVIYVGNTLDATISVVDMGWESPTRFQHIARIGLQEPYSQ